MQKFTYVRAFRAALLCGFVSLTACDAPEASYVPVAPELTSVGSGGLLFCPTVQARQGTGIALPLVGGILSVAGNSVVVPAAAISGITRITVDVPASPWMLVDLRANGQEHWQFLAPLTVTIDYSRCNVGLLDPPLTVWYVDPETGEMLEPMVGIDSRLTRTITFVTDHFSGYAIAN